MRYNNIFWQYYSRIKAKEYANLALPKKLKVLKLRRGSLLDEADIQRGARRKRNKIIPGRVGGVFPDHPHQPPLGRGGRGI